MSRVILLLALSAFAACLPGRSDGSLPPGERPPLEGDADTDADADADTDSGTDADGFDDGEEQADGTNPTYA